MSITPYPVRVMSTSRRPCVLADTDKLPTNQIEGAFSNKTMISHPFFTSYHLVCFSGRRWGNPLLARHPNLRRLSETLRPGRHRQVHPAQSPLVQQGELPRWTREPPATLRRGRRRFAGPRGAAPEHLSPDQEVLLDLGEDLHATPRRG